MSAGYSSLDYIIHCERAIELVLIFSVLSLS